MKKTLKSNEKSRGVTPATALLNRLIGPSPAPRMLTPYEITLLRQCVREVAEVAQKVFARKKKHGGKPLNIR